MKRCAVCTNKFYPDEKFHYLCSDCYENYGLYGDEEWGKHLSALSTLINDKITQEQAEQVAGFASVHKLVVDWISDMDLESRFRLLKKEIGKLK